MHVHSTRVLVLIPANTLTTTRMCTRAHTHTHTHTPHSLSLSLSLSLSYLEDHPQEDVAEPQPGAEGGPRELPLQAQARQVVHAPRLGHGARQPRLLAFLPLLILGTFSWVYHSWVYLGHVGSQAHRLLRTCFVRVDDGNVCAPLPLVFDVEVQEPDDPDSENARNDGGGADVPRRRRGKRERGMRKRKRKRGKARVSN